MDILQHTADVLTRLRMGTARSDIPADINTALTQADAFAVQQLVVAGCQDHVAAWKCGLPNGDKLIAAPIHAKDVHATATCPVRCMDGKVKVEPEIAFVLGKDLPPREAPYSDAEVVESVSDVRLALELIAYRFTEPASLSFELKLADCLSNQGLLLGPSILAHKQHLPGALTLTVETDAGPSELAAQHPNQDPWLPLFWLANFLTREHGGLKAGQAVITGSYAGVVDLPPAGQSRIRFGDLGEMFVNWDSAA
ncbi:hypothetical protein [Leeia oryzae]|uniref:hypothetical protein n=1 Tax=Leeia oryzae TaxID=356662 RepID=UPI00039D045F|nr:hypothetical protein [Leeia oryzae]